MDTVAPISTAGQASSGTLRESCELEVPLAAGILRGYLQNKTGD
jgi:hypothetical protein